MADRRFSLVILVAIIVAVGSGFGVFSVLRTAKASASATSTVLVAAADLPDGHVIVSADVKPALLPSAAIPAGAYSTTDSVIGRVTRMPVIAGEPMVSGRFVPVGVGAGLEVRIARGKRAMAVRIDDVAGLAGLIQPNSRVDVLLIVQGAGGAVDQARVFMSNMRVLSVGSQLDPATVSRGDAVATMATLEVTTSQAERLAMAVSSGRIQLVLRGYGDPDTSTSTGASTRDLPIRREAENVAPAPPVVLARARAPRLVAPAVADVPNIAAAPIAVSPAVSAVVPAAVPAVVRPSRPDSVTVQVYRGAAVTMNAVSKKDSIRP